MGCCTAEREGATPLTARGAAELDAIPLDSKRVGAVLDHLDAKLLGQLVRCLHVRHLPAHVREHHVLDGVVGLQFAAQIVDAHHVRVGRLDVDRHAAGVVDCRRHRREREGVGQHLVARLHARSLERNEKRRAGRVEANRVLEARGLAHVSLGERGLREHARRVPEQRAGLHQLQSTLLPSLWNRVGHRERLAEGGSGDAVHRRARGTLHPVGFRRNRPHRGLQRTTRGDHKREHVVP